MTYIPVDVIVDQKGKQRHRIDTLNLLAYVVLLVLVLVTTWFFKRRRRLPIHETGLAIIYGIIMGAALRYFGLEVTVTSALLVDQLPQSAPADYVIVEARNLAYKNATQSHLYAYEFRGELQKSAKLGSQISYASVDPEVFFNIILPPIVLNAGLSLKRVHFFRNIGAIFSYAFIGTTISVAFVGGFIYGAIHLLKSLLGDSYLADQFSLSSCLYFGAIISPTDPLAVLAIFQELGVDVNLFALVFGESILNDAVSIVLTHSVDQFSLIYGRNPYYPVTLILWQCLCNFLQMLFSSCLIGVIFGIATALTTKFAHLQETPLLETSLVVLTSYCSFLTAEVADASGIVAILLCGITQAHYTINNLSFEARERIKNLFELLTFLCETFLFLAIGVTLWQRNQTWDFSFIGIAFVAVILARALSVYPLTVLLNLGRRNKIPCSFQHVIAWGGAARGVISYSLAARNTVGDARRIMLSTTSAIVIFSVIVVGGVIERMLKCLRIPFDEKRSQEEQLALPASNNPNWLVRPKRILCSTSGSVRTPRVQRYSQSQPSITATPVLEIQPIWTNQDSNFNGPSRHARSETSLKTTDELNSQSSLVAAEAGRAHGSSIEQDEEEDGRSKSVVGSLAIEQHSLPPDQPYENANLVRCWRNVDNNFIKPLLTNSHPTLMETLPPRLRSVARFFTSDEQLMLQARN